MSEVDEDFDVWSERLNIRCGGYNSRIDCDLLEAAKIVRASKGFACAEIQKELQCEERYAELLLYILASVKFEQRLGDKYFYQSEPFTYGTSPRGLFVESPEAADELIEQLERLVAAWSHPAP